MKYTAIGLINMLVAVGLLLKPGAATLDLTLAALNMGMGWLLIMYGRKP